MTPQAWSRLARLMGRLLALAVLFTLVLVIAAVGVGAFIWIVRQIGGL